MTVEKLIQVLQDLPKEKVVCLADELENGEFGWSNIDKVIEKEAVIYITNEQDVLFEQ